MKISQYEAIINEKNASLGLVINLDFYQVEEILKKNLTYEVFHKEKTLRVLSEDNDEIWFINLTDPVIYYAFKTETLVLLGGTEEANGKIKVFSEAILL